MAAPVGGEGQEGRLNMKANAKPNMNRNPSGKGGPKPGEIRNPAGRPPNTKFFSDYAKDFASLTIKEVQSIADDEDEIAGRALAARQWMSAHEGDQDSIDRIINRTEGPVTIKTEVTSNVSLELSDDATLIARTKAMFGGAVIAGGGATLPIQAAQGRADGVSEQPKED